ncbi:MAG: class F sortase, partial [Nocardioides sp.]
SGVRMAKRCARWGAAILVIAIGCTSGGSSVSAASGEVVSKARIASKNASCSRENTVAFAPVSLSVRRLGRVRVRALKPFADGVPRALPINAVGKSQMAWDRPGAKAGATRGHVLMNAHLWTDPNGVGNRLTAVLKDGAVVRLRGAAGQVQCYRVTRRVVRKPSPRLARLYYGTARSKHRLAILTCAGTRRGPGDWSHRSIWLARPID